MKVNSVTTYGWLRDLRQVTQVTRFDYEKGNDVTVVAYRYYPIYNKQGQIEMAPRPSSVDLMA